MLLRVWNSLPFGGFVSKVFWIHLSNELAKDSTLFSHSWLNSGDLLAWPHKNSFLRSRLRCESWDISGVMEQVRALLLENTCLPAIRSHSWHVKGSNFMSLGNINLSLLIFTAGSERESWGNCELWFDSSSVMLKELMEKYQERTVLIYLKKKTNRFRELLTEKLGTEY